jgi:hypothetical protein
LWNYAEKKRDDTRERNTWRAVVEESSNDFPAAQFDEKLSGNISTKVSSEILGSVL